MMNSEIFSVFGITFLFLTFFSYISIWILLKSRLLSFFIDKPGIRKVHQNSTPRAGGVCLTLVFLGTLVVWYILNNRMLPVLQSTLFLPIFYFTISIFFIGFFDDTTFVNIKNKYKFMYELLVTSIIVLLYPLNLNTVTIIPNVTISLGWVSIPLSIIWIVGVANAVNIIDGIDGLAGSTTLIGLVSIGLLAGFAGNLTIVFLCLILAALNIGFLFHNISPARIFLGDTGSLFFGILLGFLSLYIISQPEKQYSLVVVPLLVGFPILDVFIAITRRYLKTFLKGKNVFQSIKSILKADNEHIHHRLMYKGLSHTNTCIILILFSIIFSTSALILSFIEHGSMVKILFFILVYLSIMVTWFLVKLNFGDRVISLFKKIILTSENGTTIRDKAKVSICVINGDEVLHHSLNQCNQNYFTFSFLDNKTFPLKENPFSVVIINNMGPESMDDDITLYYDILTHKYDCHVIIIADSNISHKYLEQSITFKSKPLYIPQLLVDIYPFALNNHNSNAFENAFIGIEQERKEAVIRNNVLHQDPAFVK